MMKKIFLFFCLMICFGHSFAQSIEADLAKVQKLTDGKSYNDALVLLEKSLEKYPDDKQLLITKAYLYDAKGDRIEALKILIYTRNRYPESDTAINSLGVMFRYSGMLDSALNCYNEGLKISKNHADSFMFNMNIGGILIDKQDYNNAIAHYEIMLKNNPDSLGTMANLAQALSYAHQNDKALSLMESIVKKDPKFEGAYNNIGLLCTEMKLYDKAYKNFRLGLDISPDDAFLLNNYGYLLYQMKDYNRALAQINKSISLNNTNPYAYRNRALIFIRLNLMNEVCKDLHASAELGFKIYYGDEVEELTKKHCTSK